MTSGKTMKRVGMTSVKIFRAAESMVRKDVIQLQAPAIPEAANYVMFDCEGLPPELDELDKVYLWGLQVFGRNNCRYLGVTAGFGPNGDQQGWQAFLDTAEHILAENGDVRFVHWHHYERTKLTSYIERFGDLRGTAARVKALLLDLLPVTQAAVVLPLPSYSLKVVEKFVGFTRTLPEANGDWSMAAFIEATETTDKRRRDELMDDIRQYNREDLEATWAVLNWLRSWGRAH
jgi:predicted RecB family nuclease